MNHQFPLVGFYLFHYAVEVRERPVYDAYVLAALEEDLGLGPYGALFHLLGDLLHFLFRDRRGCLLPDHKTRHLGNVLDQVPRVVGKLHVDEYVATEKLPRGRPLYTLYHVDDLLDGHEHLAEEVFLAERFYLLLQRGLYLILISGVGVDHVPFFHHIRLSQYQADDLAQSQVNEAKEYRQEYSHGHHDPRGGHGLLFSRPGDFLKLLPGLRKKLFALVYLFHLRIMLRGPTGALKKTTSPALEAPLSAYVRSAPGRRRH